MKFVSMPKKFIMSMKCFILVIVSSRLFIFIALVWKHTLSMTKKFVFIEKQKLFISLLFLLIVRNTLSSFTCLHLSLSFSLYLKKDDISQMFGFVWIFISQEFKTFVRIQHFFNTTMYSFNNEYDIRESSDV